MIGGLAFENGFMRERAGAGDPDDEPLIGAVASAFESDPASEAEFIAQVAAESGGRRPDLVRRLAAIAPSAGS